MGDPKKCEQHCWHVRSSVTDGMGRKGYDAVYCCWCGVPGTRPWTWVPDPKHGPHAGLTVRIDEEVVTHV